MARLKMEWKAQMRSKQQQVMPAQPNTYNERDALSYQQEQQERQPQPAVSANCIDLTVDDDSEEDDEPLVPVRHHLQALRSPPRSMHAAINIVESAPLMNARVESTHVSLGHDTSSRVAPEAEPVESDVDEEWPQPAQPPRTNLYDTSVQAPMRLSSSLSFSADEDQESEEDEELPKRVADSSTKRAAAVQVTDLTGGEQQVTAVSEQVPSIDVPEDYQVKASDAGVANAESAVQEKKPGSTSPANSDAVITSQGEAGLCGPTAKKDNAAAGDDEYLEDGEIFEEGAVIASPTKVKQAIALERLASRTSGDSETTSPQRQKKQKKRGKKKSKRKLDAMLMVAGDKDRVAGPGFERNTRHHPFLPTAALDQHIAEVDSMMMMYGGPHPLPPGTGGGFGAHPPLPPPPPPHLRMHGGPPIPGGPSMPPQFAGPPPSSSGPFPPFADDQILRVNRHGNVEMFNSNVEYPRGMPPPLLPPQPPAMVGGFKYRSVPPHPTRAPESMNTGSSTGNSSSSNSNQSPEKPGDAAGVNKAKATTEERFDLDSLRAAALRTKRLSKTVSENESAEADAVMTKERSATPSSPAVPKVTSNTTAKVNTTPSIDELRAEILRSMMMKKKTARPATASAGLTQSQMQQKSESGAAKVSSPVSVDQQQQQPDERNGPGVQASEVHKTPSPPPAQDAAVVEKKAIVSMPTTPSTPPPPPRVDYSSLAVSTAATFITPKFRPLTASSQSIVICLSPEDYTKNSKTGDNGGASSSSGSSTIQSAIDEMRKKIAEKEKLRNESRSGVVGGDGGQKNAAANNVETVAETKKTAENENGRQTPESNSALANAEAAKKNVATRTSLQARIEEMKKQIAAKEMEKSNNGTSSSSSASSSARASATSSPRVIKKPTTDPPATTSAAVTTNGVSVTTCVPSTATVRVAAMAREAPAAADDPQKKTPCTSSTSKDVLTVEPLSKEENVGSLDQRQPQQQQEDVASQPESTVSGSADKNSKEYSQVLPKEKLDEYQKLYSTCVADYEEARNQVATLDNAIAKLRGEIALMESASAVPSSG